MGGQDRLYGARVALFFGALFLVYGAQMPYLPVWLDGQGLTATEIAMITAAPLVLRLVATPAVAFLADRSGRHRTVLILLAWSGCLVLLLLSQSRGFWPLLLLSALAGLCLSTVMPLTETVAMTGVRRAGLDYGRMRLWGSLTFVLASYVAGAMVDLWGSDAAIWAIVGGAASTVVAAHLLPQRHRGDAEDAPSAARRLRIADVAALMCAPPMLLFLVAAGSVQSAHAVLYTFGTLHWRSQGIGPAMISLFWMAGIAAEVVLFLYSGEVMRRTGAVALLIAGAVASIVRWGVMAFDPPVAVLLPLSVLHGLTYAAAHLGAIHFIARAVPEQQAGTAQALYATITAGVGMGGAMLVAGQAYATWGGRTYLLMVVLSVVALATSLLLARVWSGREIGR